MILITGISGLAGSNLASYLSSRHSNQIVGISRDRLTKQQQELLELDNIIWCQGDIQNYNFIRRVLSDYEIEYVFNLAANSIVRICETDPIGAIEINTLAPVKLLEACKKTKSIKGIIQMSSDKYYGDINPPLVENLSPNPEGVYEVSKTTCDILCRFWAKHYDLPVIVVRGANLYGPKDLNTSRLIPGSIVRILSGKRPMLYSNVQNYVREFVYVKDACEILTKLMNKADKYGGHAVNLGSGNIYKIKDLIELLIKTIGLNLDIEIREKAVAFKEIPKQYLDLTKLKSMIGEIPVTPMKEGFLETVNWYAKLVNN